jgi:hypothetical protein
MNRLYIFRPGGVGSSLRRLRSNSFCPISSSSLASCTLKAGCTTFSRCAAPVIVPSSLTLATQRSCRNSKARQLVIAIYY